MLRTLQQIKKMKKEVNFRSIFSILLVATFILSLVFIVNSGKVSAKIHIVQKELLMEHGVKMFP